MYNLNHVENAIESLNSAITWLGGNCQREEACILMQLNVTGLDEDKLCGPCAAYWHLLRGYRLCYELKESMRDAVVSEIITDC